MAKVDLKYIWDEPHSQSIITIYSRRKYGQPKLAKPKELKGIKQSFSVDWILNKCRCACYVLGNDIWIKHRDFGSVEIHNHQHEFRRKFIYNDAFGCVVLRGEAWILLKDFILDIKDDVFEAKIVQSLAEQVTGEFGNCEWERFFERVIREYRKLTK